MEEVIVAQYCCHSSSAADGAAVCRRGSRLEVEGLGINVSTATDAKNRTPTSLAIDDLHTNSMKHSTNRPSYHLPFLLLLNPGFRKPLLVGVGLMLVQQFSGISAVISFTNSIFATATSSETSPTTNKSTSDASSMDDSAARGTITGSHSVATISVLVTQVLVAVVAAAIVDK